MASTTITLNDPAYARLKNLKRPGQSFSDVVLEHLGPPADTCGELLEVMEQRPAPKGLDVERMDAYLKSRGRRSNRK
jgi:predicted CopG family antitoxin